MFVAPPAYAEVVTEEQRQSCLEVSSGREDFDGPLYAYIQEFRFQPPPPYSEVNISNKLYVTRFADDERLERWENQLLRTKCPANSCKPNRLT